MTTTKRVGAMLVLASLAFVLVGSAMPAPRETDSNTSAMPEAVISQRFYSEQRGGAGIAVRASDRSPHQAPVALPAAEGVETDAGLVSLRLARTTPRAILVPRGQPLTIERNEDDPELAIVEAAREFSQDPALMLCVARAESGLDMEAAGHAGEVGAFQFLSRTFKANGKRLGYRLADITSVVAQARVAAEMWSRKQQWQWNTYARCQR